jgi:dUTP pyrophosphatase
VSVLSREQLRAALAGDPPLVESVTEEQLQPNGIDLRIDRVHRLLSPARFAERVEPADREELAPDGEGWWELAAGAYVIGYRERVNLPNDLMAFARPRSSLLRSGVAVHTAVWDAGYSGRGEGLLSVLNPAGWRVRRGARVVQLVFMRLAAPAGEGYRGSYQGE